MFFNTFCYILCISRSRIQIVSTLRNRNASPIPETRSVTRECHLLLVTPFFRISWFYSYPGLVLDRHSLRTVEGRPTFADPQAVLSSRSRGYQRTVKHLLPHTCAFRLCFLGDNSGGESSKGLVALNRSGHLSEGSPVSWKGHYSKETAAQSIEAMIGEFMWYYGRLMTRRFPSTN